MINKKSQRDDIIIDTRDGAINVTGMDIKKAVSQRLFNALPQGLEPWTL